MSQDVLIQKPKRNKIGFILALLSIVFFGMVIFFGSRKAAWKTSYEKNKSFYDGEATFEFELESKEKYKFFIVTYTYSQKIYYYVLESTLIYPSGKKIAIDKYFTPQIENNNKPHLVADSRILFKVKGQEGRFKLEVKLKEMRNNAKIDSVKLVIKK